MDSIIDSLIKDKSKEFEVLWHELQDSSIFHVASESNFESEHGGAFGNFTKINPFADFYNHNQFGKSG